jgi:GT2 family glycosyltransferase
MTRLSVSIVIYYPKWDVLARTVRDLARAAEAAQHTGTLFETTLNLISNEPDAQSNQKLEVLLNEEWRVHGFKCVIRSGHGNVGYGRGHNLAIEVADTDFHLILNPDVFMERDALSNALRHMRDHSEVGLLTPRIADERGERVAQCYSYPSLFVLFLRGFCPTPVRRLFQQQIDRYLLQDRDWEHIVDDVPIATGAFMFCRTAILKELGGFSPRYFLYFEDFDLSLRMRRQARITYFPDVRIAHLGGGSARKGRRHIQMFVESAFTFFRSHGWKLI